MNIDYYLSSLQYQLVKSLSMTPKLGIYESCSVPSHLLLYSIVFLSVLISVGGVLFYKKFVVKKKFSCCYFLILI